VAHYRGIERCPPQDAPPDIRCRAGRTGPDDADPVDRRISNLDLFDAILRLPEQQREAVVLHHLADLPLEEIARRLGVAVGTLKSRLARGRSTLADLLGDERPFPEGAQP